ncbi:MAG: carbon-nitrogen family hydrolase [Chitinivibrionales bacterium]|nr:carbon-nitrogen family hydrolase [Chitinivibrionales bacterium]
MKIGLAQTNICWESKGSNLKRADGFIKQAANEGCDCIIFPEMFATGFSMDTTLTGESRNGETCKYLSDASKRHRTAILAGYALRKGEREEMYNCAAAFDSRGELTGEYAKIHLFSPGHEDSYYTPGKSPAVFDFAGVRASMFICYDLRFPEIFRKVASEVRIIFVIANWPSRRQDHWNILLKARAIENQCYIAGVNRSGKDGNSILYTGGSAVYGPAGKTVYLAGSSEELGIAEIAPERVDRIRNKFPVLKDMKKEMLI